jgi:hypothetical protein
MTVEGEAVLHFNGERIRVLPLPGGHTPGDLIVHFTGSRVACVGDLVFGGTFPDADPARGGNVFRLIEVLRTLNEVLPAGTTLVTGHGPDLRVEELPAYVEMVEGTLAAVQAEFEAGYGLEQILQRRPLQPWAQWEGEDPGLSFAGWTTKIHRALAGGVRTSICQPVTEILVREGVEAATDEYRRLAREQPDHWDFGRRQLNTLGYQLLRRDRVDDAIAIFRLNVERFPEESDPYDSLGEAYMESGQTELAIANYERSLELNPANANAVERLSILREM